MLSTKKLIYKILQKLNEQTILTESRTIQLTWASTSNPYASGTVNLAKDGYVPISAGYTLTGTGASAIYASSFRLDGNGILSYSFRSVNTPSSTTQNGVTIDVKYIRI